MKRILLLAIVSVVAAEHGSAQAQWWDQPWGWHASTPAEGYARGMADLTRSAGMANLLDAQAAIAAEEARTKAIQNDLFATETYFNKKAVNRANREATRRAPLTTDRLAAISRSRMPDTLNIDQFDPVTGEIYWPLVLQGSDYAAYRQRLEKLFAERAAAGGALTIEQAQSIQSLTTDLTATLRNNIRNYPTSAYLEARNFVDSLSFEGRL